jgi:hypothetical protein
MRGVARPSDADFIRDPVRVVGVNQDIALICRMVA